MRLKKGLYVELHWLLRQLSGVEASQLSCANSCKDHLWRRKRKTTC